jgi:hypothetical protein
MLTAVCHRNVKLNYGYQNRVVRGKLPNGSRAEYICLGGQWHLKIGTCQTGGSPAIVDYITERILVPKGVIHSPADLQAQMDALGVQSDPYYGKN